MNSVAKTGVSRLADNVEAFGCRIGCLSRNGSVARLRLLVGAEAGAVLASELRCRAVAEAPPDAVTGIAQALGGAWGEGGPLRVAAICG